MNKQSLGFKIRVWLVRRISGSYNFDKLTERHDRHLIHTAVNTMYDNLRQYIDQTTQDSVNNLPQEILSQVIAANVHLTDIQKSQIASIISAPCQRDNSSNYFV